MVLFSSAFSSTISDMYDIGSMGSVSVPYWKSRHLAGTVSAISTKFRTLNLVDYIIL